MRTGFSKGWTRDGKTDCQWTGLMEQATHATLSHPLPPTSRDRMFGEWKSAPSPLPKAVF
jgi:hypothetical protein